MKQFFKTAAWLLIATFCVTVSSCGDDDDDVYVPGADSSSIVGKWQKFATVESDGSLSGGDPDEFWIFNCDGSFVNEDGGNVTTRGTYTVDGSTLTIMSREVDGDLEEENFTGTFKIDGKYMDYTFTEIGDDDYRTYRFLKQ